jgi:hypothetical protein
MSKLFTITDIPEYDRLTWTVTWPGRGVVRRQRYKMLEFAAQSGDWRVGFCTEKECASVNTVVLLSTNWEPEMLDHLFETTKELTGLAFTERRYAERFVELAERHIAWNLLKQRAEEHN